MKILISSAIWGEAYCSIFARYSLATLLSRENIPEVAKQSEITYHIVTTRADKKRLLRYPAVAALRRHCKIEWELMEDYRLYEPPVGPGGEKYPFLSALQNLSIRRSIDHDVIVFNYADFIWADGSLKNALAMLSDGRQPLDAVFAFCLPVDRDSAVAALEVHRKPSSPDVIELAPRAGAKIAVDCIHREAKIRFWEETPRFTNLPSYLIWRVGDRGLLLRAYHQSILAMRVRAHDPQYLQGILRGGLDSSFAGHLAKSTSLAFANDSDAVLVFSLYHTIVDSRVPKGVTREMSLRSVLIGDVTPDQRRFAERPIYLRVRDGKEVDWSRAAEASWNMLRQAQDTTPFDQSVYDKNYETHGVVPKITRLSATNRFVVSHLWTVADWLAKAHIVESRLAALHQSSERVRGALCTVRSPRLWLVEVERVLAGMPSRHRAQRIWFVVQHPTLLRAAIKRRLERSLGNSATTRFVVSHLWTLADRLTRTHIVGFRLAALHQSIERIRGALSVVRSPRLWLVEVERVLARMPSWRRAQQIWFVVQRPIFLRAAIKRRLVRSLRNSVSLGLSDAAIEALLMGGDADGVEIAFLERASYATVSPGIRIEPVVNARFMAAVFVEGMTSRVVDAGRLLKALRAAEALLRRAINTAPLWAELTRALGRNLWFQGRFSEAIETFGAGELLRNDMARTAGWPVDSCVFLPRNCAEVIGLMGHMEAFVKHKILTNDQRRYYLLIPSQNIVNRAFLDYWREYIEVVSEPERIAELAQLEPVYGVNWNWVLPKGGRTVFVHDGMAAVQRAWQRTGRGPVLHLRADHAEMLRAARLEWGMKEGERFICLHVRSIGFYGQTREQSQRFRNTTIDAYYELIRAITDMGLWVIRMGDASMPQLNLAECGDSGRVVDYAVSPDRSAELDVALCAQCELFVSSPSGLHTVAHAFGRPVCEVNYPIYNGFPWHPIDIFAPQLYFSHGKNRVLTLEEILGTDVVHLDHQFLLDRAGISLIANEPDDIVETVREALAPSAYRVTHEAIADKVCAAFGEFNQKYDVGISGRLGRYFAMKYSSRLLPDQGPAPETSQTVLLPKGRRLDFLIPCFNRPRYLHEILKSGLALGIPGAYFVVFDDASSAFEQVPGLGSVTVEMVCRSFKDKRVIYLRNPTNMGVAKSLERYYREFCDAAYTSLLNPKDEFISSAPVVSALAKLDSDPALSFVVYPLRQIDRSESDKPLLFKYDRMSGREFVAAHVRDSMLQHCSGYAILRVDALRRCGIPRDLDLRAFGLEDASGIDHEMIYNLATTGDVEFESEAPIRRSIVDGYTERFPLTFAYSQYQYARRLMGELEPRGFVTAETRRLYLGFWHLIIARGLVVAYRHVYGSEQERGVSRIRPHLSIPILFYLPLECIRWRVMPSAEAIRTYFTGARLLLSDWINKCRGRPHIA